jgi:hypothetical protein
MNNHGFCSDIRVPQSSPRLTVHLIDDASRLALFVNFRQTGALLQRSLDPIRASSYALDLAVMHSRLSALEK